MLASSLISIHNISVLIHLVEEAREAILDGTFTQFADDFLSHYQPDSQREPT
jgi:tRNA-guanine family transglycosylase